MNAAKLKRAGITIRQRLRSSSSPRPGMDQTWIEHQVCDGRRIIGRHDSYSDAVKAAEKILTEECRP